MAPLACFALPVFKVAVWVGVLNYVNLWPRQNTVLNARTAPPNTPSPPACTPGEMSIELRKRITAMYGKYMAENGEYIDYNALAKSQEFSDYSDLSESLANVDALSMSEAEKKAFFINVYNSLLIHAITRLGAPADLLSRLRLYSVASYSELPCKCTYSFLHMFPPRMHAYSAKAPERHVWRVCVFVDSHMHMHTQKSENTCACTCKYPCDTRPHSNSSAYTGAEGTSASHAYTQIYLAYILQADGAHYGLYAFIYMHTFSLYAYTYIHT
jgi:hypothetical protein